MRVFGTLSVGTERKRVVLKQRCHHRWDVKTRWVCPALSWYSGRGHGGIRPGVFPGETDRPSKMCGVEKREPRQTTWVQFPDVTFSEVMFRKLFKRCSPQIPHR